MLRVNCPEWIIDRFKKAAKEYFPKECLAYLYGQVNGLTMTVEGLWFPDDLAENCFDALIICPPHWPLEAREIAKEHDAVVLGDIHSHPWKHKDLTDYTSPDHAQSQVDLDSRGFDWMQITGICLIREQKNKKLRASVRFWGPTVPLDVNINPVQTLQRHVHDETYDEAL